jgi:hypothetical protein
VSTSASARSSTKAAKKAEKEQRVQAALQRKGANGSRIPAASASQPSASDNSAAPGHPLRVLLLHGYSQNGSVLRARIGALRKDVNAFCTFTAVDAPVTLSTQRQPEPGTSDRSSRAWWALKRVSLDGVSQSVTAAPAATATSASSGSSSSAASIPPAEQHYSRLDESVSVIRSALSRERIDGLFCFSQGAAFGALLLALQRYGTLTQRLPEQLSDEERTLLERARPVVEPLAAAGGEADMTFSWLSGVRFAVFVSGFVPRAAALQVLFPPRLPLVAASLHVLGTEDKNVSNEESQRLAALFPNGEHCVHDGAHIVPSDKQNRAKIHAFLQRMSSTPPQRLSNETKAPESSEANAASASSGLSSAV